MDDLIEDLKEGLSTAANNTGGCGLGGWSIVEGCNCSFCYYTRLVERADQHLDVD